MDLSLVTKPFFYGGCNATSPGSIIGGQYSRFQRLSMSEQETGVLDILSELTSIMVECIGPAPHLQAISSPPKSEAYLWCSSLC